MEALPLEMLESLLMKSFTVAFKQYYKKNIHGAGGKAYSLLASVGDGWLQTLNGWPQSDTKHWFKHQLKKQVKTMCVQYDETPKFVEEWQMPDIQSAVLLYTGFLYTLHERDSTIGMTDVVTGETKDFEVSGLEVPNDIIACPQTDQLYVCDLRKEGGCIWKISPDGKKYEKFIVRPQFSPVTMSMRAGRLLVTTNNERFLLFGSDGILIRKIAPAGCGMALHAVETDHETFILSQDEPATVREVDIDGIEIRRYNGPDELTFPGYLELDLDGRVFVADYNSVLLLNDELEIQRVLLDESKIEFVDGFSVLRYMSELGQLIVIAVSVSIKVFNVHRPIKNAAAAE